MDEITKYKKWILGAVAALLFLLFKPFYCVSAGHKGVVLELGAVSSTVLSEGVNFIVPGYQRVIEIDTRVQKTTTKAGSASKDLQTVKVVIALNYHLSPSKVNTIYGKVGEDVEDIIISPAVQESVKAVTARYTAEQLITERKDVSNSINEILKKRLEKYYILIDDFSIEDFKFSDAFEQAIEAKQTAEQQALKAQRETERIKEEAKQKIEEAQAEAKSLSLRKQQLTPLMIQAEWINKWNGELPQYMLNDKSGMMFMQK